VDLQLTPVAPLCLSDSVIKRKDLSKVVDQQIFLKNLIECGSPCLIKVAHNQLGTDPFSTSFPLVESHLRFDLALVLFELRKCVQVAGTSLVSSFPSDHTPRLNRAITNIISNTITIIKRDSVRSNHTQLVRSAASCSLHKKFNTASRDGVFRRRRPQPTPSSTSRPAPMFVHLVVDTCGVVAG
jgi:hypothetical protein